MRLAGQVTWYEAAAFVNWLNTSTGHQAAYSGGWSMSLWSSAQSWQLGGENLYRHKDAYYFLPSEDEWYKAAFHKNDGVTANYWDYATGSNSVPDAIDSNGDPNYQAVFAGGGPGPTVEGGHIGLRVASIPEPGSAALLAVAALPLLLRRRRR